MLFLGYWRVVMSKKSLIITLSCVAGGLFALFAVIMAIVLANDNAALPVDTAVANWAYNVRGEKGNFVYWFFRIITEFGYTYVTVSIILIMAIVWRFKVKTWFLGVPVLVAWGLHKVIKWIVNRPRPDMTMWWATETSSSFPSGHSNTVACLFGLIIFFIIISPVLKTWLKWLLCSLSGLVIILVPLSRIILGMHYFTDVLAGLCFGGMCALIGILLYVILVKNKQPKEVQTQNTAPPQTEEAKE